MPVESNAIVRAKIWSEHEKREYEVRIFRRPDGNFTKGDYKNDKVLDAKHTGELLPIDAEDIELVFKLLTGNDFDF